jgi:hypothetical protein
MIALMLIGVLLGTIAVAVVANKFPMQIGDDEY